MPSLYQIKSDQDYKYDYAQSNKSSPLATFAKFAVAIAIGIGGYLYYIQPKVIHIPEKVIVHHESNRFIELLATPVKKIIWFGADCPYSAQRKNIINMILKHTKLDGNYEQRPFLQDRLIVRCTECLDEFLLKNCNDGVCIIVPSKHEVIKTTEERLVKNLIKYANY